MPERIIENMKRSLLAAGDLYHRLILLVGGTGSGKTAVLRKLARDLNTDVINVNLLLSKKLLDLTARQRALQPPDILNRVVVDTNDPIVLDNLELLFDHSLGQDPLRLLLSISRNHTIISSWNGSFDGKRLSYAESGHPEERQYESVDALIVTMNGTTTMDLRKIDKGVGPA